MSKETLSKLDPAAVHRVPLHFMLNVKNDADIIERLNAVRNKQGYIKRLIREDIIREQIRAEMNADAQK